MGHGPALHVQTYAHVIDAVQGKRYADLDELHRGGARPAGVPRECRKLRLSARFACIWRSCCAT